MTRPLVVLDALLLRPRPTGVGRAIMDWTSGLAAADRGVDFAVLCTHPEMLEPLADRPGWELVPCPGARGGTLRKAWWTQAVMPGLLGRLNADLLHAMQFVAPMRSPCPTVVTVYDLGYHLYAETVEQPRRSYYQIMVPRSLRRAAAVACISEATAADVRQTFANLTAPVVVTPLACPTWIEGRASMGRARADDAPFLFVGTLEPRKNLEGMLLAYREFCTQRARDGLVAPRLVLVGGRGWRDSGIWEVLEPLQTSGQVEVLDYCDFDELWRQYGLARALLFPSLHEGFGLPILEAMHADLPVMTSDRGAMAEVAGNAALLVDPGSRDAMVAALHRLTDDVSLREDLIGAGRQQRDLWTWERTAQATAGLYRSVLT